jgi:multicomponent Na+:H+ antiporter subunit B
MTPTLRKWIFLPAVIGFAVLFLWGLQDVPPLGIYRGPYGDVINQTVVNQRHITDAVTAVTFDYRGVDTLGEEFILFVSVTGVMILLRQHTDETKHSPVDMAEDRSVPPMSDAVRVLGLYLMGLTALFGIYIVTHGQISPGGGFQGGVIIASALLLVYIAGGFGEFQGFISPAVVEVAEAFGIGSYVLLGLLGLFFGAAFLQNVLPLGKSGSINSGGTVPLISTAVGLAVSAGFVILLYTFLEDTLVYRLRGKSQ